MPYLTLRGARTARLRVTPSLQDGVATFEILLGALHGFGVQLKVDGVKVLRLQLSAPVDA